MLPLIINVFNYRTEEFSNNNDCVNYLITVLLSILQLQIEPTTLMHVLHYTLLLREPFPTNSSLIHFYKFLCHLLHIDFKADLGIYIFYYLLFYLLIRHE